MGFDYSAQSNYKPYYTIGSETPSEVKYIGPTTYNATVQMEVDDVMPQSGYTFLTSGKNGKDTVSLSVNWKNGTTLKSEALKSGLINEKEYDKIVDPKKMIYPT